MLKENQSSSKQTSPKGFSASKCDVGNWIFSKSKEFFEKLLGKILDLWGNFLEDFLGGIFGRNFWEEFFGRNFFGRIFLEEVFGRNFWEKFLGGYFWEDFLLKSAKLFEYGRN